MHSTLSLILMMCTLCTLVVPLQQASCQPLAAQVPMPAPSFRKQQTASLGQSPVAGSSSQQSRMLFGQVGESVVLTNAVKQQLGLQTASMADSAFSITAVRDGSPAFKSGLQVGDLITNADRDGDLIALTVQRDNRSRTFNLSLASDGDMPVLSLRLPRMDNTPQVRSPFQLNAEQLATLSDRNQQPPVAKVAEAGRFLSKYDVELIVDASMSMRKPDCPGFMPRFIWCASQSVDLARQLAPFASQGITLTSFNRNFYVYEHQNPQQLTTLFARTQLAPNTRLAEPLADRLNDYLIHRPNAKPRLIAVITDGVPHPAEQMQLVEDVLIHASNMIQDPRELTVVFFQIGSRDSLGQQFLSEIDNNLVARGAHFDIVQTVSFEHLQQVGLAQGLADAIRSFDYKSRHR